MKILITGGMGFLGGRLAALWSASADHSLVLGSRRSGPAPASAPDAAVVSMEWSREDSLASLCEGCDAVVHLAAMNARECAQDPVAAFEFNCVATARLVRAAIRSGVSRFIYLSTAHVYGAALRGRVDERTCPEPKHPYATSHRAAEDLVRAAHDERAIAGVVMRLSNSFGAPAGTGNDSSWALVINDLCRQAVQARRIVLKTAGLQRRDFVAVSETCRGIDHLLSAPAPGLGDGVFNLGGAWTPSVLEVARTIAGRVEAICGFQPSIECGTSVDAVGAEPLDYRFDRIRESGFESRANAAMEEIDHLIRHCAQAQGRS